jgi:hypothetical protein
VEPCEIAGFSSTFRALIFHGKFTSRVSFYPT